MNTWQLLREIKNVLNDQLWTGGSNQVFGADSAIVTGGPEDQAGAAVRFPAALIRPLDASVDPNHGQQPDFIRQRIGIRILQAIAGDVLGEFPLIGGFWTTAGAIDSDGRGLLEIEEELYNALKLLSADDGVEIQLMAAGATQAVMNESLGYLSYRDYEFEAWVTASRDYPPGREFAAGGLTSGVVSMTWSNPSTTRYDFRRMMLRRIAGSSAPTATTGTELVLSSDTAVAHTDSPGSGTFTYGIFAVYDDRADPPATDREFSAVDSATAVVP